MKLLRPRDSLGPYELVRALGSGGMGVVYEARHRALGRRVAIKVLHASDPGLPGAAVASARFLREGRVAAQVRHPHVVDVFDIGVEDGVPYLVMELVQGETLAEKIAREGALSLATTAELLLPVVSAVAELHAAGIVHRDLKPANILLARGRAGEIHPKVADFGVSWLDDGSPAITERNAIIGTYAYMAPEQACSPKGATDRSDLYSLGVIAYECATGRKPFDAPSQLRIVEAILNAPLVAPSMWNPALPPAFDALVARAMNRDPGARFIAAEELGEALLAFAKPGVAARWASELVPPRSRETPTSIRSVTSTPTPAPMARAWGRARASAKVASVAAAALLVVTVLAAGIAGGGRSAAKREVASPVEVARAIVPASTTPTATPTAAATPRRAAPPPKPPTLDNGAPILDP